MNNDIDLTERPPENPAIREWREFREKRDARIEREKRENRERIERERKELAAEKRAERAAEDDARVDAILRTEWAIARSSVESEAEFNKQLPKLRQEYRLREQSELIARTRATIRQKMSL